MRVGGGSENYINRMYEHGADEELVPIKLSGYSVTNLTLPDSAMRGFFEDENLFTFKMSPREDLIDMEYLFTNTTFFMGLSLQFRKGDYLWIPGRTQVSFSMDRMYSSEMRWLPNFNRVNSSVGDQLSVVSSHHVSVIAKTESNCTEASIGTGYGLVKIAPRSWAAKNVFCRSYEIDGHKHDYEIQVNASMEYSIVNDNHTAHYGYLTFVVMDQFNASNVGETLSTGQSNFTSLNDLPQYFFTDNKRFVTVFTDVEVFRKQEGIRFAVIMPWLAALMAIYSIGMIVSITGTYSAGASVAELIYRGEVMEERDSMGNKVEWWERLLLPPSHLRSHIKYMKSGSTEEDDLHVTVVMDNKRLMAVPSDVAGDVLLKTRSLIDIKREEFAEVAKSAGASRPNDYMCVSADNEEPYRGTKSLEIT
ncbi:hypothetical protein GcM1_160012 [Golovinomyces cichoracearum]|uniref:Uncharacterized protein n=1 Tax=Golovinomyces cichoracearum TaxID=62708 RepID=A0A420J984_9PEZI|nr:hypothetical protein GcM1_160012 [Golovinomyces cichoracearum]